MMHRLGIHWKGTRWLNHHLRDFSAAANSMIRQGISFDMVSDRQLRELVRMREGRLSSVGSTYKALVVAGCRRMPPETLERIAELASDAASVLVVGDLPEDAPGLGALEKRRGLLAKARVSLVSAPRVHIAKGAGGSTLAPLFRGVGIKRETMTDRGLRFVRRRNDNGWTYFVVNHGMERIDGWTPFSVEASSVVLFDPMWKRRGLAAVRSGATPGRTGVYLQLAPGESMILRATSQRVDGPRWRYVAQSGPVEALSGPWKLTFVEGGPALPSPTTIAKLTSWTNRLGKTDCEEQLAARRAFSGTARYEIVFDKPTVEADAWALDLGRVADSARVTLNGTVLGTALARPLRVPVDELREKDNRLEVEVTNLMANRISDMKRRRQNWAKYYFVRIRSGRYDRSGKSPTWEPFESGLLGPVRLIPMKTKNVTRTDADNAKKRNGQSQKGQATRVFERQEHAS
jgi:hypothetical protein